MSDPYAEFLPYISMKANTENMHSQFMDNFVNMATDYYQATGNRLRIDDAWRSNETQAKAYADWKAGKKKAPSVAPPGHSYHEKGMAMDINSLQANELAKLGLLEKYGFHRPMNNEPWHIQLADFETRAGKVAANIDPYAEFIVPENNPYAGMEPTEVPSLETMTQAAQEQLAEQGMVPASGPKKDLMWKSVKRFIPSVPTLDQLGRGWERYVTSPDAYQNVNKDIMEGITSPEAAAMGALDPMVAVAGLGGVRAAINPVASQKVAKTLTERAGANQLSTLARYVEGVGEQFNPGQIQGLMNLAKNYGIELTVPELTNSPTLRAAFIRLAKTPGPEAEKIANYIQTIRNPQIQAAIDRELAAISPVGASGAQTGGMAKAAAQNIEEKLINQRKIGTQGLYKKAFENPVAVETEPIIANLQSAMSKYPEGHPARNTMSQVERMLTGEIEAVPQVYPLAGKSQETLSKLTKAEDNFDRGTIIKEFGGFNSQASIFRNFSPEERRKLFPYMRKGSQGPDELLQELKGNYPHLFSEFETDADMLRAIIDGKLKKPVDYEKYMAQVERQAMQEEQVAKNLGLDYGWEPTVTNIGDKKAITDLETLHNAKVGIDQLIEKAKADRSLDNDTRRLLAGIKAKLTGAMERDNPLYGEAQRTFRLLSKPINDFRFGNPEIMPRDPKTATLISRIGNIAPEQVEKIPGMIFAENPGVIDRTRKYFENNYPGTWDAVIRQHLENKLSQASKDSIISREGNAARRFRDMVFNGPGAREKFRVALSPERYTRLERFFDLIDKTRRIIYTNSETAFMMEAGRMIEQGGATGIIKEIPTDKTGLMKWLAKRFDNLNNSEYAANLTDALLNGSNAKEISRLARMPDGPRKGLETAIFLENIYSKGAPMTTKMEQ